MAVGSSLQTQGQQGNWRSNKTQSARQQDWLTVDASDQGDLPRLSDWPTSLLLHSRMCTRNHVWLSQHLTWYKLQSDMYYISGNSSRRGIGVPTWYKCQLRLYS